MPSLGFYLHTSWEFKYAVSDPAPASLAQAACVTLKAALAWWDLHRYVFSGEQGTAFRAEFTHPALHAPLRTLFASHEVLRQEATELTAKHLDQHEVPPTHREALTAWLDNA